MLKSLKVLAAGTLMALALSTFHQAGGQARSQAGGDQARSQAGGQARDPSYHTEARDPSYHTEARDPSYHTEARDPSHHAKARPNDGDTAPPHDSPTRSTFAEHQEGGGKEHAFQNRYG